MGMNASISGIGLWTPENVVTNEELVASYNSWAEMFNESNKAEIEKGLVEAKPFSSAEFILKASGIKQRYVYQKEGILDIYRMRPLISARSDEQVSHQAEMALNAAKMALESAGRTAEDIDTVIVACAYTQRSYPAIAIEVQAALGIVGHGFDMLVACSAATFGLQRAVDAVKSGSSKGVLVINPELTSPQVNYMDRDSHFIFGDVATALVVEPSEKVVSPHAFEVLGVKCVTQFSNNIRSNFGYITRATDEDPYSSDKLFHQNGRKVFKEVCPMAADHIENHIRFIGLEASKIKRWWLHQANINMNTLIVKRLLGREGDRIEAPIVLDEYANTASAGSIIAFAKHHRDLKTGDLGVLCSFGAGYSIGSLILCKH